MTTIRQMVPGLLHLVPGVKQTRHDLDTSETYLCRVCRVCRVIQQAYVHTHAQRESFLNRVGTPGIVGTLACLTALRRAGFLFKSAHNPALEAR